MRLRPVRRAVGATDWALQRGVPALSHSSTISRILGGATRRPRVTAGELQPECPITVRHLQLTRTARGPHPTPKLQIERSGWSRAAYYDSRLQGGDLRLGYAPGPGRSSERRTRPTESHPAVDAIKTQAAAASECGSHDLSARPPGPAGLGAARPAPARGPGPSAGPG